MEFQVINNVLKKYEGNAEHVIIPEGVKEIGDYAFYGAHAMRTVTFPESLNAIGMNAFYDCASLKEVILPDSLSFLGSAAFSRCSNLKRVWLPDSVHTLNRVTFFQCEKLEQIRMPVTLTRIGRACFEKCRSLRVMVLPETLTVLEDNVFDECIQLEAVFLPESLKEIGNNVFIDCENLKELNIGKNVGKIGKGAFETKGQLKLSFPEHLRVTPEMLDNRWNMYWNSGTGSSYSVKNERKYLLHDSYIPNVDLNQWKPEARCILALNYLESWKNTIETYDGWIREHHRECLEMMIPQKRFNALNTALEKEIITPEQLFPYLDRITDRDEKARLLAMNQAHESSDDLLNIDLDDLF